MGKIRLDLIEKQINQLRKELDDRIKISNSDLSSPEVLEVNHQIDKLLVTYLKATLNQ